MERRQTRLSEKVASSCTKKSYKGAPMISLSTRLSESANARLHHSTMGAVLSPSTTQSGSKEWLSASEIAAAIVAGTLVEIMAYRRKSRRDSCDTVAVTWRAALYATSRAL